MYCNQITGAWRYGDPGGVAVVLRQSVADITLDEAAMLAGIIQSPERQSPFVNMQAALRRRTYASIA